MLPVHELQRRLIVVRTLLVALGMGAIAFWLVALVDGSTAWLTWLTGGLGAGCFVLVALDRAVGSGAVAAMQIGALASAALASFAGAIAGHATSWLAWSVLSLGAGLAATGVLALLLGLGLSAESRRPIGEL